MTVILSRYFIRILTAFFTTAVTLTVPATAAEEAHIAVAANFKPAMDALKEAFEAQSDHELVISNGSTGKLYAQIVHGAPYDIFLAADQQRPRLLEETDIAVPGSRVTYATGRLVLWDPSGTPIGKDRLRQGGFRHLAIANPRLAPYGAAAMDVLASLKLADPLQSTLVYGENIGQTFSFVYTGNAELGFVALSQVLSLPENRGSYWEPPQELYMPISQDAVLLNRGEPNPAAQAFYDFLMSDAARDIIRSMGYEVQDDGS